MPSETQMKAALQAYLDGLNARDADAVLALFAPDAEIEDPVGSPIKRGAEIEAWFRGAVKVEPKLELCAPIRGSHSDAAVMTFTVESLRGGTRYRTHSTDVARFDARGRITRLEGYWGPGDRQELPQPAGSTPEHDSEEEER